MTPERWNEKTDDQKNAHVIAFLHGQVAMNLDRDRMPDGLAFDFSRAYEWLAKQARTCPAMDSYNAA